MLSITTRAGTSLCLSSSKLTYLRMDRKKIHPGGAEKHRTKKLKSIEVKAAKCAKLTDLFGAVTTPAAAGVSPGDKRGGPGPSQQTDAVSNVNLGLARLYFLDMSKTK